VAILPKRVCFGRLAQLPKLTPFVVEYEVMAINSGTAFRVPFVALLGGFNSAYWLDSLDHWLFRKIYGHGKRVAISGSVFKHNFAVSDYRRNKVSLIRYRSILSAEEMLVATEKRRVEILVYVIRLVLRVVKRLVIYRRPELAALSCKMVVSIIVSRARLSRFGL
jgi:hypothetical protein